MLAYADLVHSFKLQPGPHWTPPVELGVVKMSLIQHP